MVHGLNQIIELNNQQSISPLTGSVTGACYPSNKNRKWRRQIHAIEKNQQGDQFEIVRHR